MKKPRFIPMTDDEYKHQIEMDRLEDRFNKMMEEMDNDEMKKKGYLHVWDAKEDELSIIRAGLK